MRNHHADRWGWELMRWVLGLMLVLGGVDVNRVCGALQVREVQVGLERAEGFTWMRSGRTGVQFTNTIRAETALTNRNLLSGSGVALGDVDGDGRCDVYFSALEGGNRLYRNLGDWRFEDVTSRAAVECLGQHSTGAVLVDVDGDGDLDLLVSSLGGGVRLFRNEGGWKFTERTDEAGLRSGAGATSMALADVDHDGDLDLYVCHFRPATVLDRPGTQFKVEGRGMDARVVEVDGRSAASLDLTNRFAVAPSGQIMEWGEVDGFYENDGHGTFRRISFLGGRFLNEEGEALKEEPRDWGLAAMFYDMNGDGWPDLYVCNDLFTPDRIWLNDGKGGFRAIPWLAVRNNSTFSMGVDFGDLNRDGFLDFFTVDMLSRDHGHRMTQVAEGRRPVLPPGVISYRAQLPRNTLHQGRGDGTFAEVAFQAGVAASEWSWGPLFMDVDLDGWEDILVPNGQLRDFQNGDLAHSIETARAAKDFTMDKLIGVFGQFPGLVTTNVIFRNLGGMRFEECAARWGWGFPVISQGTALGDLDGDGDLDVVSNQLGEEAGLFRNDCTAPRVAVKLKYRSGNGSGVGAKIRLLNGAVPFQEQEVIAGGRYLSGDDGLRTFAVGGKPGGMVLEVRWPDGETFRVDSVKPNAVYEVSYGDGVKSAEKPKGALGQRLFRDVSGSLGHVHDEEMVDDMARQPLLSRKLSQLGPAVGWVDWNGDGRDDVVVGAGRGGRFAAFVVQSDGRWVRDTQAMLQKPVGRDQNSLLVLGGAVLVGSANWEDGSAQGGAVRIYDPRRKASGELLLGVDCSTGPICAADVDGDGDLDLFVGARAVAGRYPEPGESRWYRNDSGKFQMVEKLEGAGLVTGAMFGDWDGDGDPDLVTVSEWGPVQVWMNEKGHFVARDMGVGMYTGWWNSVILADLDEDGRLDLAAGNWGLNHPYPTSVEHPYSVYFGEMRSEERMDLVESYFWKERGMEVPFRTMSVVSTALPFIRDQMGSYRVYGESSLDSIYGNRLQNCRRAQAGFFSSAIFLNRGDRLEMRLLPAEAQWSPCFGLAAADVDGDGHVDLVMSQNFFACAGDGWRSDAGRGLVLLGNGQGSFRAELLSGLEIYGEGRGLAVGDYDQDGRWDVLAGQNGAETKLYHNVGGRAGVRVNVRGAALNAAAVGLQLRGRFEGGWGALMEVHSGGGYGSQDSLTPILTGRGKLMEVALRWPGGVWQTNAVNSNATVLDLSQGRP